MRALVIGRGSMGKRRLRDLKTLGVDAQSWDATDGPGAPYRMAIDAAIISSPPLTHRAHVEMFKDYNPVPCFTEADVQDAGQDHFPSATPLFTDWYASLSSHRDVWDATSYILHVGQHIDDWHPGADKATYYAYKDETSPTREMIPFELIWLSKLFGPVARAEGQRSPELAVVRVEHERGVVGRIIIDAVSRPPVRTFEVFGAANRRWALTYEESHYLAEMRAFIAVVKGEQPWPYSQAEEAANLEVLHMIERTSAI